MAQAENAKKLDYTPVTYDDQYILMVNQLKKYFPIKNKSIQSIFRLRIMLFHQSNSPIHKDLISGV